MKKGLRMSFIKHKLAKKSCTCHLSTSSAPLPRSGQTCPPGQRRGCLISQRFQRGGGEKTLTETEGAAVVLIPCHRSHCGACSWMSIERGRNQRAKTPVGGLDEGNSPRSSSWTDPSLKSAKKEYRPKRWLIDWFNYLTDWMKFWNGYTVINLQERFFFKVNNDTY